LCCRLLLRRSDIRDTQYAARTYRIRNLSENVLGKGSPKMSRLRWKDNIKMHFRLIRCEVANMFSWGIVVEDCEHGNEN
jgi:hypothetical protein